MVGVLEQRIRLAMQDPERKGLWSLNADAQCGFITDPKPDVLYRKQTHVRLPGGLAATDRESAILNDR